MRERQALVAYEQSNSTYDVHRSDRLGCDLHEARRITKVTPFGYSRRKEESPLIEPEPLEEDVRLQAIVDRIDFAVFSVVGRRLGDVRRDAVSGPVVRVREQLCERLRERPHRERCDR